MARRKVSSAALARLEAKGITVNVVKAEQPAPINEPVVTKEKETVGAAPKISRQTTKTKQWKLENIERDWDGYIKSIIITEI